MIYLLDTNACIHHLKFSNSPVTRKLAALLPTDIAVCYDLQIAAIAMANSLTLVTHNVREFSRVEDLTIEDWEAGDLF